MVQSLRPHIGRHRLFTTNKIYNLIGNSRVHVQTEHTSNLSILCTRSQLASQLEKPTPHDFDQKHETENLKNDPSHEKEKGNTLPGMRGGGGGHKFVYEISPLHREEPGKRPFSIRFGPKGVSIQTKKGTYTQQTSQGRTTGTQNFKQFQIKLKPCANPSNSPKTQKR